MPRERSPIAGARVIATTHYSLLKEMAEVDPRFANASVEFDPETLAPTYRLRVGLPGQLLGDRRSRARMGLRGDVLERANQFLDREDRRLDRMLHELAASRAALESEQREAARAAPRSRRRCARSTAQKLESSRSGATSSTARCAKTSTRSSRTRTRRSPR